MKTKGQEGVALLMAIFVLFFITLLVVAFLDITTIDLQIVKNQTTSLKALYIADAGIEDAIYELRQDKGWEEGFAEKPYSTGSGNIYTVIVDIDLVSGTYPNEFYIKTLTSTGTVYSGTTTAQRTIEAQTLVTGRTPGPYKVRISSWKEEV